MHQQIYESQATALPAMNIIKEEVMDPLTDQNRTIPSSFEGPSSSPNAQKNDTEIQKKLVGAEKKIEVKLEPMFEQDSQLRDFELVDDEMKFEELKIEMPFWEGERSSSFTMTAPNEKVEQLEELTEISEKISVGVREYESTMNGTLSADTGNVLEQEAKKTRSRVNGQNKALQSKKKLTEEEENVRSGILEGDIYVLSSDTKFFTIDWRTHYERVHSKEYNCNMCSQIKRTRVLMQDHIWTKHHGGWFKCPLCINSSYTTRFTVVAHMKKKHSKLFRL